MVKISQGYPRFGRQPDWESELLFPPESILGLPEMPFTRAYLAHLDQIGVPAIRAELAELPVDAMLCCFEALKKPGQFCHRRIFAFWWARQTGQVIAEL